MSFDYVSSPDYLSVKDKEPCVCNKEVDSGDDTKCEVIPNIVRMEGTTRILGAISLDNEMIRDFKRGMENYRNSTSLTTKPAITPNILRMEGNPRILSAISLDNEMIRDFKRGMEAYKNTMKPLPSLEQAAKGGGPKN